MPSNPLKFRIRTLEKLYQINKDYIDEQMYNLNQYSEVMNIVSRVYEIKPHYILLKSRMREVIFARQMCMLFIYHQSKRTISWGKLASMFYIFGGDHSIAIYSIEQVSYRVRTYEFEKQLWERLKPYLSTVPITTFTSLQFRNYGQH